MSAQRWANRPDLLRPVSEWAAQELTVALSITTPAAERLLDQSLTLVHRLPRVLDALGAGALHPGHLWHLLDKLGPLTDDDVRADVEQALLDWAAGRVTTPPELGDKARRELMKRDAWNAARRLATALRERGVHPHTGPVEGMGALQILGTLPETQALYLALGAYADALDDTPTPDSTTPDSTPGDGDTGGDVGAAGQSGAAPAGPRRTRAQKMLDCLLDLVLRPGEHDLPPVQIDLSLIAPIGTVLGGDAPGELGGVPVPADMVRALLRAFTGTGTGTGTGSAEATDTASKPDAVSKPDAAQPQAAQPDAAQPDAVSKPDAAQPQAAEARAAAAEAARPGAAPEDPARRTEDGFVPAISPLELAWLHLEQQDLLAWGAETERRILAGELDDPDPPTDAQLAAWLATAAPPPDQDPPDDGGPPEQQPPGGDGPPDDGPPGPDPENRAAPPARPPAGARWWADADTAVDAASQALHRLLEAMGHARRAVAAAAAADTAARTADAAARARWHTGPTTPDGTGATPDPASGPGPADTDTPEETGTPDPRGARGAAARDILDVLAAATDQQLADLGDLLTATGGGGLTHRPRLILTDTLTGALRALTDLPGLRRAAHCGAPACRRRPQRCDHDLTDRPGLGPPAPTPRYRPSAALDRWLRARDRRCRFPGCRRPVPTTGELDHNTPHPDGPTSAANMAGYCTADHRGKHQATGWRHHLAPDGTLTVTTPTGLVATTTPPPY